MGYFGIRYVTLDSLRAEIMKRDTREIFSTTKYKHLLKTVTNSAFVCVCLILPLVCLSARTFGSSLACILSIAS